MRTAASVQHRPAANAEQVRPRHCVTDSGGTAPGMVFSHGFGCDQTIRRLLAPVVQVGHSVGAMIDRFAANERTELSRDCLRPC